MVKGFCVNFNLDFSEPNMDKALKNPNQTVKANLDSNRAV